MPKKAVAFVWCRVCKCRRGHEHITENTYRCKVCGDLNSTVPAQLAVQMVAERRQPNKKENPR